METNQLTITDLDDLRNVIELACSRGAFQASEMQDVGTLYNKLNQFVDHLMTQAQIQAQSESTITQGE